MSKSLSQTFPQDDQEINALLSVKARDPEIDPFDLEVGLLVQAVRGQLLAAMNEKGVTQSEIGKRIGVSRAMVNRALRSEGDMHLSTAAILAFALKKYWDVKLKDSLPDRWKNNYDVWWDVNGKRTAPESNDISRSKAQIEKAGLSDNKGSGPVISFYVIR